jgi:molybdopterin-biosynthesis enzyme MoeA-like protein
MSDCGKKWAKNDPEGLIKAINGKEKTAALVNKAGSGKLKNFMRALGRDAIHPFGWTGGDVIFSTMFSAEAEKRGKTPLEALDEGVLWFLPKGVVDAQKKALFGYEGTPSGAYKMEGHAGGYNQSQINDMKNYLDMEDSDRKYFAAKDKRENFETMRYDSEVTKKRVLDKIDATIKKHGTASSDSIMEIYNRNTGLRTDGTPRMEDMNLEQLQSFMTTIGENLWGVQQKYAIDEINRSKQGDLNTLYAKKDDPFDVIAPVVRKGASKLGIPFPEEGQLPFGMGPTGNISTLITDPYDIYRASSPQTASENLPVGVKQGWQYILDLWNKGLISQEEKERYAKEMGREDLLQKERQYHPDIKYGTSLDFEDMKRVFPEYYSDFNQGGRVPFGKGKLVDEGRRAFMKWIAGITGATVAAGTGILKWGKVAGKGKTIVKAGDHIIQDTPGMPDWFIPLVNRVVKEGDDVSKKLATVDREIVHTKKLGEGKFADEVTVYQDMNTGNVRVEFESIHNMGEAPIQLEYRAGQVVEEGKHAGKKSKSEFDAVESEPVGRSQGPDDYSIEWDGENVVGKVDDLTSDTSKLKQFATKRKLTHKDKIIAKKKQKAVQEVHKNESDYIVKKQGEADWDDYLPDIDDID